MNGTIKKILAIAACAVAATTLSFAASACKLRSPDAQYYDEATVYAQAQKLGYGGTLEEFIALISGKDGVDGKDGVGVENAYIEDGRLFVVLTNGDKIDCGEIEDAHTHSFGEWQPVNKSNCTQSEVQLRGCECGHMEMKVLPPKGHGEPLIHISESEHSISCSDCYESLEIGEHTFENKVCTVCGYTEPITFNFILPIADATVLKKFELAQNGAGIYVMHRAIDFGAAANTQIVSAENGVVEAIKEDEILGSEITIRHNDKFITKYTYAVAIPTLNVGDTVNKGDVIATVQPACGSENNDGDHLHFEIFVNGQAEDPEKYITLQ